MTDERETIGALFLKAVRFWARRGRHWPTLVGIWRRMRRAQRRRRQHERQGLVVPAVLAISPTAECNLSCRGCYAAGQPRGDTLPLSRIDALLTEAAALGVFAVVVTGGEPLLRPGLLEVLAAHRDLAFVLITNGAPMTPAVARRIGRLRHVVTLVSLEGFCDATDARRGPGAFRAATVAMARLRGAGALFGFASIVTAAGASEVTSEAFIDAMVRRGCALGFLTDYVPAGPDPHWDWVAPVEVKREVRRRVLHLRRSRPLALVQFPDDEYDAAGRCRAAGRGSVHVNAQGLLEPCPFAPFARENIRDVPLAEALRSPFLAAIRAHPALLTRDRLGCALFENREALQRLAAEHGAHRTDAPAAAPSSHTAPA